jgi:hypothetical protein
MRSVHSSACLLYHAYHTFHSCTVRTASTARTTHAPVHTLPHAPHALYIRTVLAVLHCHVKFTHHMQRTHVIHCTQTRTSTHRLSAPHHPTVRNTAPTTNAIHHHAPHTQGANTHCTYQLLISYAIIPPLVFPSSSSLYPRLTTLRTGRTCCGRRR